MQYRDKPNSSGYQTIVQTVMERCFPPGSSIPWDLLVTASRFYTLDLGPVDEILNPTYAETGRPAKWAAQSMLRSMLLSIEMGVPSITKWCARLHIDPYCRTLSGFDPDNGDKVPGVGTFYDFANRLWASTKADINEHYFTPKERKRKVKAPKDPNDPDRKADPVEKIALEELIRQLKGEDPKNNAPYARLFRIFRKIFLQGSIDRKLVDLLHLKIAGDGTPVVTAARQRSYLSDPTEPDDPFHPDENKVRYYSQPDCDYGYDSHRHKYYYGYSLYMLTEVGSRQCLPIFPLLGPASEHDSYAFARAFHGLQSFLPEAHVEEVLMDSAHDVNAYYKLFHNKGISAYIDLNPRGRKKKADKGSKSKKDKTGNSGAESADDNSDDARKDTAAEPKPTPADDDKGKGKDGVPVCQANLRMKYDGSDKKTGFLKFRCPMMGPDGKCQCQHLCSTSDYGHVVKVKKDSSLRYYGDEYTPPRMSRAWKQEYKKRSDGERCNQYIKNDQHLEAGHHRSTMMWTIRLFLCMMLRHLRAWTKYPSQLLKALGRGQP